MRKFTIITIILLFALSIPTFAADNDRVVLGSELSEADISSAYETFEVSRGEVTELYLADSSVTNYLANISDEFEIDNKNNTAIYAVLSDKENSVDVQGEINASEGMFLSALQTAGIDGVSVIVTSNSETDGVSALLSILYAYENMSGTPLTTEQKSASVLEFITALSMSGELDIDGIMTIITELKLATEEISAMTDEELTVKINEIAEDIGIPITDYHRGILINLARDFGEIDTTALVEGAEKVQSTLEKIGEYKEKAFWLWEALVNMFKAIGEFFSRIMSIFG